MTLSFDIPDDIDLGDARQVLRDALAEFIHERTPVEEYVAQRYSDHDESFRDYKVDTVTDRIEIAQFLRQQI